MKKTAWIIGASTGLGRETAERLAQQDYNLILSSRSQRDLEALCSHIKIKYKASASAFMIDLETISDVSRSKECLDQLIKANTYPDACFFLAGSINDKDEHLHAADTLNSLLQNNFRGPVLLINELVVRKSENSLRVVVASTVAAARARGKNIAYSTAKRALEQYCFGLMHSLAQTNVTIQIYRFGYMDTNLSYGQKLPFPAASVASIAAGLLKDSKKGPGLYYSPKFWFWITFILNLIPFSIYKKLKF